MRVLYFFTAILISALMLVSCSATNPAAPGTTNYVNVTNTVVVTNVYTTTNGGLIKLIFTAPFTTNTNGRTAQYTRISNSFIRWDSVISGKGFYTNVTNAAAGVMMIDLGINMFPGDGYFDVSSDYWGSVLPSLTSNTLRATTNLVQINP